jgi:hypothetical protein
MNGEILLFTVRPLSFVFGENFTAPQNGGKFVDKLANRSDNNSIGENDCRKPLLYCKFVQTMTTAFSKLFKFGDWRSRCHVTTRLPV